MIYQEVIIRGQRKFQSQTEVFSMFSPNAQISIAGRTSKHASLVNQANITPLVKGGARVTDFAISEPWNRFEGFSDRFQQKNQPTNYFIGTERA
jgi:hypothetical protein